MLIVEIFNNDLRCAMATMNFSIPDDLKEAFNRVFKGENKSAVVAGLIRKAIEERKRRAKQDKELDALIEELLRIRAEDPPATDEEIRRVRLEGRA
jgi:metal-responsive CopG/Arc/MetJ family transcriptional regulator